MKCKPVKEHYPTFRKNCITQIGNWRHNSSLAHYKLCEEKYGVVFSLQILQKRRQLFKNRSVNRCFAAPDITGCVRSICNGYNRFFWVVSQDNRIGMLKDTVQL